MHLIILIEHLSLISGCENWDRYNFKASLKTIVILICCSGILRRINYMAPSGSLAVLALDL